MRPSESIRRHRVLPSDQPPDHSDRLAPRRGTDADGPDRSKPEAPFGARIVGGFDRRSALRVLGGVRPVEFPSNNSEEVGATPLALSPGVRQALCVTTNGPSALDIERPIAALREAVVDGLLIETQIVPMDRALAEALADRVMEAVELRALTVLDRGQVARWYGAIESNLLPMLLQLRGRGVGICDVRGHHEMVVVEANGWPYDLCVCQDCELASQVELGDDDTYTESS